MSKRLQGIVIGGILGALIVGGVAFAYVVPTIDPSPTDRYYACVSSAGKVKPATMKLNVQPSGCSNATDTIRSWNAQGPQGPIGPSRPLGLASGAQQIATTSTTFEDIPGASEVVTVAGDNTLLLIEFSGVLGCASSSFPNDGDACTARILVDGQPTEPALGPEGYMLAREVPDYLSGGGYSERAFVTVGQGAHTVSMQWKVQDVGPLNDGTTWYLNYWTLTVDQVGP